LSVEAWWNSSTITTSKRSFWPSGDVHLGERLDGGEDVVPAHRVLAVDESLAEAGVAHRVAVGVRRLSEDLAAVGHKEQRGAALRLGAEPAVVEGGDHRLARTRGGHHEVAMAVVQVALGLEAVEDLLLEGARAQLEDGGERAIGSLGLDLSGEALLVVGLELRVVPVGVEGAAELVEHRAVLHLREADVPLEAGDEGRAGEVGRADVGRREAAVAVEEPGLRVQAGGVGAVGDADFGALLDEVFDDAGLGDAAVGRGEGAELSAGLEVGVQAGAQLAVAVPEEEGADEVDAVGGGDLLLEGEADATLAPCVHVEGRLGEWELVRPPY
jgi:hypothetical protein